MNAEEIVLQANGFSSFNPMQEKVLDIHPFQKNILVSSPTASGKTLIAEMLALHHVFNERKMVVYTCPLRALASEHYREFRKKYSSIGMKAAISTGDFDSGSKYLQNYDVILTTFEKLDSLIRHKAGWLQSVGLLVVDEIHEIDSARGTIIEITITQLRTMNPEMKILGLSATIPNSMEMSKWLNAELIESNYRPIPLQKGVHFNEKIHFEETVEKIEGKQALPALIKNTVENKKKQALVFANTRKRAEGVAREFAAIVSGMLEENQKKGLEKYSERILNVLEHPTEQCRALSEVVRKGIAFHHAGLLQRQREAVEEAFRENYLKVLCATTTLAAGINMPAHTVVIPSIYRYSAEGMGMEKIPVREYFQMAGRAGRPKYDTDGRAVLLAKTEFEMEQLFDEYIFGEMAPIASWLGQEPLLRMHLLGLVSGNFVFDLASMKEFFSKTFFAKQYGSMDGLFEKLQRILRELQEMGFVEANDKMFKATSIGKRVAELYLDPLSAFAVIQSLKKAEKYSETGYLFMLSSTTEFFPQFSVTKSRETELWKKLQADSERLPVSVEKEMFFDNSLLQKFNSSLVLGEWISETTEQEILKQFSIQPGFLFSKLQICDWLCYAVVELSKLLHQEQHAFQMAKLRARLKHGVKEELLVLTQIRGIGRVRARRLFKAKIQSIRDIRNTDIVDLKRVLGEKVAESVKAAVGQKQ